MNPIDLSNCCYPPEENRLYNINSDYTLHMGVNHHVEGQFIFGPGQNIEMELSAWVANQVAPTQVFYSKINLIQLV
jgi:hypothetical protein